MGSDDEVDVTPKLLITGNAVKRYFGSTVVYKRGGVCKSDDLDALYHFEAASAVRHYPLVIVGFGRLIAMEISDGKHSSFTRCSAAKRVRYDVRHTKRLQG